MVARQSFLFLCQRNEGRERFDRAGVYYAATVMESETSGGEKIIVVGGGNSAGQAAVFLSENARKVLLLIRNGDLGETMSSYLIERIEQTENIEVLPNTEISPMFGAKYFEGVELKNNKTSDAPKRKRDLLEQLEIINEVAERGIKTGFSRQKIEELTSAL